MSEKYLTGTSLSGTSTTRDRIKDDYYATPQESTFKLLEVEDFKGNILEPCCGEGHISEVLKQEGYKVFSNDLIDRGYGELHKDFLTEDFEIYDNIITNPPFKYAKEFIEKSLKVTTGKVAMFCKIQLLEGVSRYEMFQDTPLKQCMYLLRDKTHYAMVHQLTRMGKNGLVQCVLRGLCGNMVTKESQQLNGYCSRLFNYL